MTLLLIIAFLVEFIILLNALWYTVFFELDYLKGVVVINIFIYVIVAIVAACIYDSCGYRRKQEDKS